MDMKAGECMKILIVEDHEKINALLTKFAKQDGHDVSQTYSAEEALDAIRKRSFDFIITDLMLPDMQGEALIRKIRDVSDIHIMVISAKKDVDDRIDVLSLGADDYLTKPFSVEEVMVKLQNTAKRIGHEKPLVYSFYDGELEVRPLGRKVVSNGRVVSLTTNEYDVFMYLLKHPNRVFTRDEIIIALFSESEAFDRVVDAYIKNIRKELNDDPKNPRYIKTVYGRGYQFVGERDD